MQSAIVVGDAVGSADGDELDGCEVGAFVDGAGEGTAVGGGEGAPSQHSSQLSYTLGQQKPSNPCTRHRGCILQSCVVVGSPVGSVDGRVVGRLLGAALGAADGNEVGTVGLGVGTVGLVLGLIVGLELGSALGASVAVDGDCDGCSEGLSVGDLDGTTVGLALGDDEGDCDGDVDGEWLGLADGSIVGPKQHGRNVAPSAAGQHSDPGG